MNEDSIPGALRARLEAGDTPEAAAAAVLADLSAARRRALLHSMLLATAAHEARFLTRRVERAVAGALEAAATPGDRVAARRALVGQSFPLADGTWVVWLDATADQHRQRAAWQRRMATACGADADLHESAAADIEAAGVKCLRDLEEAAESRAGARRSAAERPRRSTPRPAIEKLKNLGSRKDFPSTQAFHALAVRPMTVRLEMDV